MSTKKILFTSIAVATLTLSACGGSSGSKDKTATATGSSATTSASPSPTATPLTKAQLQKVSLVLADLPTGWKAGATDSSDGAGSDPTGDKLAKCVGAKNTDSDTAASYSTDFTSGAQEIQTEADSYKSASSIQEDEALLKNPKLSTCFEQQIKTEIESDTSQGKTTVDSAKINIEQPPAGSPSSLRGHLVGSLTLSGGGAAIPVYVDVYFMSRGQTELTLTVESAQTKFDDTIAQGLISKLDTRLTS